MIKKRALLTTLNQSIIALMSIYIIDLIIPLGVAVGVLYVFCIALLINESVKRIFIFSVVVSILILIVPILTTTTETTWMAYVNRGISIVSTWIAFFMARSYKKLANKMKVYTSQLEQKNKDLELFFYKSSHDLKAPFKSVDGILNLCDLKEDLVCCEHSKHMRSTLKGANKLLTDVGHIASVYSPRVEIKKINFEEVIEEVLHNLNYLQEQTKVKIKIKVSVKTPFYSDVNHILFIIQSLIHNSLIYSKLENNGTHDLLATTPFVSIDVLETKNGILMQVEDNGEGIKQEYLNNIFQMFFRGNTKKGSGLGLYIVKSVAIKLGGKVTVTSKYGEGSIFRVSLPKLWENEEEGAYVSLPFLN